jgi:phage-related protein
MSFTSVFHVNAFTFANIPSHSKRLIVGAKKVYNGPLRSVEQIAVPGLAGDLLIDNNRFENIMVEYDCYIQPANGETLAQTCRYIKNWLYFVDAGQTGYKYLTDTYDPDYRREAVYTGEFDLEQWAYEIGYVPVIFNCKPFKTRINPASVTLTAAGSLTNPETFDALPNLRVYGSGAGVLNVGDSIITISAIDEYIDINCELKYAYKGSTALGSRITLNAAGYPVLSASQPSTGNSITSSVTTGGITNISWSGGITSVVVTPRWRTL